MRTLATTSTILPAVLTYSSNTSWLGQFGGSPAVLTVAPMNPFSGLYCTQNGILFLLDLVDFVVWAAGDFHLFLAVHGLEHFLCCLLVGSCQAIHGALDGA